MLKGFYIYLVRHGESEANANNINQGHLDSQLTQKGISQALEVATLLEKVAFTSIYSSDLCRAKDTAEIIRMDRNVTIQTSSSLRERFFGALEGIDKSEYEKAIKIGLKEFESLSEEQKWKYRVHPEIESDDEVFQRFNNYLLGVINEHKNGDILIVSHRGPIRLFLAKHGLSSYENIETRNALQNTGYIKINVTDGKFSIAED